MEGIAGVVQPARSSDRRGSIRQGARVDDRRGQDGDRGPDSAGAADFVVADSHGNAQNLLIDDLPPDVRLSGAFRARSR